uniref:Muscular LMNA interacting protein n=1 Tax=Chelydra serpentina TaxID=8475 RepID=A0A8C3RRP3_CHESE
YTVTSICLGLSRKQNSSPNSSMVESGTNPLTFTFVPSIGRLPTHFQVVDVCKLLVRTSEEPNNESSQEMINRVGFYIDIVLYLLETGIRQDSESTYHAGTSQKIFQPKGCKTSKGEMQDSDLFKAEFVFITDSDEGDEEIVSRNNVQQPSVGHGTGQARCQLLATSHISSGGESSKPHGDLNVPETQCAALSHSRAAGRETRYVSPFIISVLATEMSYFTKPGVIRPGPVKTKMLLKTEEPYEPNPFKKYLEESRDPDIEQVSTLFKHHPRPPSPEFVVAVSFLRS